MGFAVLNEKMVLDRLEPRWREQGYTLVREPSQDQLPAFLKGFRPDAIALGPAPSLVIEVIKKRNGAAESKVQKLHDLFGDNQDWRLEVVYIAQDDEPLTQVGASEIRDAIDQGRLVSKANPRVGLLWAWATLEAITRNLEPELAARRLTALSMVDVLVSNGHVSQLDGKKLRALAHKRNMLAHGQVDANPEALELSVLLDLVDTLAA